jgi:hypothetical protein
VQVQKTGTLRVKGKHSGSVGRIMQVRVDDTIRRDGKRSAPQTAATSRRPVKVHGVAKNSRRNCSIGGPRNLEPSYLAHPLSKPWHVQS